MSKQKNIIIFGGAGFVGSHLCEELVKNNQVICVDNFKTSSMENIRFLLQNPNFIFIKHDINEILDLEKQPELKRLNINVQGIQEVYNLACPTSAKNFDEFVIDTVLSNSQGIKNILDLVLKYDSKLLHVSSAVVYGPRQEKEHVSEESNGQVDFLSPRACYDEGKRFAETLITTYSRHHKKNFKIARLFRTYGPRMMLNDGQMMPDFMLDALENRDLIIYGDDKFETSLLYIDDAVSALTKFMDSDLSGALNIGNHDSVLLNKVAEMIIEMVGSSSKVIFKPPLMFMTPLSLPDISKARNELGWFALTKLEDGLFKTLEFTKANKQLLSTQYQESLN